MGAKHNKCCCKPGQADCCCDVITGLSITINNFGGGPGNCRAALNGTYNIPIDFGPESGFCSGIQDEIPATCLSDLPWTLTWQMQCTESGTEIEIVFRSAPDPASMTYDSVVNIPDCCSLLLSEVITTTDHSGATFTVEAICEGGLSVTSKESKLQVPIDQWPRWAKKVKEFRIPEDKGVGGTAKRMFAKVGGEQYKAWRKKLGLPCNCSKREAEWDQLYPYS